MLANGARRRLADMVKGSCGEGDMNTAAAIHNDVLSDSGRDNRILCPSIGRVGGVHGGYSCTVDTRLEHVDPEPLEALEEAHNRCEADRDSNKRGQRSQPARRKSIGRVIEED